MKQTNFKTIDEYIAGCPTESQAKLQALRQAILTAALDAVERISYQMPTFWLNGNLVHFALMKNHIGFYPAPSGIAHFSTELAGFKTSKGAVQFPLDEDIPLAVVQKIVTFRVGENLSGKKKKIPQ